MMRDEADREWAALYRAGAAAAILTLALIPVQVVVYVVAPPPHTAIEYLEFFLPPTIRAIGIAASLLFLVRYVPWLLLVARRLLRLARGEEARGGRSDAARRADRPSLGTPGVATIPA